MEINFMENSWAFFGVISAEICSQNAYKVKKMGKILGEFDGLWNGESFRNWFDSEVEK